MNKMYHFFYTSVKQTHIRHSLKDKKIMLSRRHYKEKQCVVANEKDLYIVKGLGMTSGMCCSLTTLTI